jgi:hypothetical protein
LQALKTAGGWHEALHTFNSAGSFLQAFSAIKIRHIFHNFSKIDLFLLAQGRVPSMLMLIRDDPDDMERVKG